MISNLILAFSDIASGISSDSGILFDILSGTYSLTFYLVCFLAYTLIFYLTFLPAFYLASVLTYFQASILAFYLGAIHGIQLATWSWQEMKRKREEELHQLHLY